MSGKIGIRAQWSKSKDPRFTSYPYWSIVIDSSPCYKKRGYGIARANISRKPALKDFLMQYMRYERILDIVTGRKPEFNAFYEDLVESGNQISLMEFDNDIIEMIRNDMSQQQKWGEDYEGIKPFFKMIDDNKKQTTFVSDNESFQLNVALNYDKHKNLITFLLNEFKTNGISYEIK